MNPNPRIGVLLRQHKASARLFNALNPRFGLWGLRRFSKSYKVRDLANVGERTAREWEVLLGKRGAK